MDEGNLSGIYPREDLNREVGVGDPTLEALDHQMGNGKTCPMHARHVWEKLTDLDRESTQGLRDRAALRVLPVQGRPDPHHALHPFLQQFKKKQNEDGRKTIRQGVAEKKKAHYGDGCGPKGRVAHNIRKHGGGNRPRRD